MTIRGLRAEQVYAVVRVDPCPAGSANDGTAQDTCIFIGGHEITIKAVMRSLDQAESEVARLNALNSEKGCRYYWQTSRLLLDERSPGSGANVKRARAPRVRAGRNRARG